MPTFLSQFADAEIKVRYKEPYLTAGLNEKQAGVIPRGIHRGFRLVAGVGIYQVKIQADEETNDHVALYETATGYAIRLRKTGGDYTSNLTALAGVSDKVFVLAIYAQYVINSATTAILRAYELSPADEFTGAAERGELVVLGEVTVPAVAAPITVIDERFRSSPWESIGIGTREPAQVIKNGDFMLCSDDAPTTGEILWPCWDYPGVTETNCSFRVVATSTPKVGYQHLQLTMTAAAGQVAVLPYEGRFRIRGGCRVKGAFWAKRVGTVAPGANGHLGLRVRVYSDNPTTVLATYYIDNLTPSTSYVEMMLAFQTPSAARWMSVDIYFDDDNAASSGTLYYDDIRVWVEQPHITDGQVENFLPLHDAAITARSIDIAPMSGTYATLEEFLDYLLTLRHDTSNEFVLQRRRNIGDFLLKLVNGGLEIGNLIEDLGSSRIGSAVEGAQARITSPIPATGTAPYVLLWSIPNTVGSGGNLRIYATDNNIETRNAIVIVSNAEWTGTQWQFDVPGFAGRFDFTAIGFYGYCKEALTTSPWNDADWEDLSESWPIFSMARSRAGRAVIDTYAALTLRLSGTPTETDLETGRIIIDTGVTTTSLRTAIMDIGSVVDDAYSHTRQYNWISGSENVLEWIINAKWNETDDDFDKDDSGEVASRIMLTENGYFEISRSPIGLTPFSDGEWINLFIVNPSGDDAANLWALDGSLRFNAATGTYSNRALPSSDNILYAANIPKAWARFRTNLGVVTIREEYGIASIVVNGGDSKILDITLDRHIDSGYICAVGNAFEIGHIVNLRETGTNTFDMRGYAAAGMYQLDFSGSTMDFEIIVFGRQVP